MSDRDSYWLNRAVEAAKLGTQRMKHCALIVRSGNVLAMAVNKFRNVPGVCYHGPDTIDYRCGNPASVHAEIGALKLTSWQSSIGSTLYVARYGNNGDIALSRPCLTCWREIERRGVKKVIYTTENGRYAVERV